MTTTTQYWSSCLVEDVPCRSEREVDCVEVLTGGLRRKNVQVINERRVKVERNLCEESENT